MAGTTDRDDKPKALAPEIVQKPKPVNIHAGHRQRMRERFTETGLKGFHEHEVLELLLFHAVRRRNLNPVAHDLINRFGSLGRVLDASEEELLAVPQVGPRIAQFIRLTPVLARHCVAALQDPVRFYIRTPQDIMEALEDKLESQQDPILYFLLMDRLGVHLNTCTLSSEARLPTPKQVLNLDRNSRIRRCVVVECTTEPLDTRVRRRIPQAQHLYEQLKLLEMPMVDFCIWSIPEQELVSFQQCQVFSAI